MTEAVQRARIASTNLESREVRKETVCSQGLVVHNIYQKQEGSLTFSEIGIQTNSAQKEVRFTTSWRNPQGISVNELNHFDGLLFSDMPHILSLKVTDSKLFLRESLWQFIGEHNICSFGEQRYIFDHCVLASNVGKISINGEISKYSDKECNIQLEKFDISLVNSLTSKMSMSFFCKFKIPFFVG